MSLVVIGYSNNLITKPQQQIYNNKSILNQLRHCDDRLQDAAKSLTWILAELSSNLGIEAWKSLMAIMQIIYAILRTKLPGITV